MIVWWSVGPFSALLIYSFHDNSLWKEGSVGKAVYRQRVSVSAIPAEVSLLTAWKHAFKCFVALDTIANTIEPPAVLAFPVCFVKGNLEASLSLRYQTFLIDSKPAARSLCLWDWLVLSEPCHNTVVWLKSSAYGPKSQHLTHSDQLWKLSSLACLDFAY